MCSPNIWGNQRWAALSLGDNRGGWQDWGVFVEDGATDRRLGWWHGSSTVLYPAPLSWKPSKLSRRGEAGEHGSVYSAVIAPCHRSLPVSPQLGASAVTSTAGVSCYRSKGFWPKLTFVDSQIINFSLMAILCKHNTPTFLYSVPFRHCKLAWCRFLFLHYKRRLVSWIATSSISKQ